MDDTFVKLFRRFDSWEWYKCPNTKAVFIHLLINVNFKPSKYMGHDIPSGSLPTGYNALAEQVGISVRSARTAIKRLKDTGEITVKTTSKFSIISLTKWDTYQHNEKTNDKQVTSKRQASDKQVTTLKEGKKVRREEDKTNSSISHFDSLWEIWGKGPRKADARDWFAKKGRYKDPDFFAMLETKIKELHAWRKNKGDSGDFVPCLPAFVVWLNQSRWEDELEQSSHNIDYLEGCR